MFFCGYLGARLDPEAKMNSRVTPALGAHLLWVAPTHTTIHTQKEDLYHNLFFSTKQNYSTYGHCKKFMW